MSANRWCFIASIILTIGIDVAPWACAEDDKEGPFFAIIEENDLLSNPFSTDHQDRHYTHGIKFVYIGGTERVPRWVGSLSRILPSFGITAPINHAGIVLGQNIYTPDNLSSSEIVPGDRPYAGWLYIGAVLLRRSETPVRHVPVMESFEINLGIIGSEALAKQAQVNVHRWRFPDDIPKGWDNQLGTEPGLVIKYGRLWKISAQTDRIGVALNYDFIPHIGVSIGNIQTFTALGGTLRVGWNLPNDFGIQTVDSTASIHGGYNSSDPSLGCHLYGRVEGRAVANNIFLDGNAFRESHRVDKQLFVTDLSFGFVVQMTRHIDISFTRVFRTEEFKGQDGHDIFGGLSIKSKFRF